MYSIFKNSYLQSRTSSVNPRTINRCIDHARDQYVLDPFDLEPPFCRLVTEQPHIPIDNVDETKRPVGFGRWAMPKLRRELHDKDEVVVIAALTSICDLVHDPERAYEALNLKIPDRLADLLLDFLVPIRERAILALSILARQADGKEAIVSNPVILENLKLNMSDTQISIRMKTASCLQVISEAWSTADVLVEYEFIQKILEYIQQEDEQIVEIYFDTLKGLMYGCGKCVAMKNDAFKICLNYLEHNNSSIVAKALDCLAMLIILPKGKRIAIQKDLLHILNKLLHYGNREVCTSAASVLMVCTVRTRAKILAAEMKNLPKRLVKLASSLTNPDLQLSCIKALTNICEHPLVRQQVFELYLPDLEDLQVNDYNLIHKNILLEVVNWRPEVLKSDQ